MTWQGRAYNVIGTGELDLTSATLSTSASYALGSGTGLRINAADATTVSITDTGSDSAVVVEALELRDDADLGSISVSSLTASVTVANTVTLDGDLNGSTLTIAGVSGTPVLDLTDAGTIGALDFGDNALKVVMTAAQYSGLSTITNVTGNQVIEIQNATASELTVTQVAGVEEYILNPENADGDITFTLISGGDAVALTRDGTDAAVTVAASDDATFTGTWSTFATGDALLVAASKTVNVEGVNSGSDLGGLVTIDVASGSTFVAKAVQVADASMTGTGIVTVKNLEGDLDADLSGLASGLTVTAELSSTGDVELLAAADLTNVDTMQVTGTGTVTVNASATLGGGTFDIGDGSTLSLTATQANGLSATAAGNRRSYRNRPRNNDKLVRVCIGDDS